MHPMDDKDKGSNLIPAPFEVELEEASDGHTNVRLRGELDLSTASDLERVLETIPDRATTRVLVDLTDCEFIDSTGIALIIGAWRRIDRDGGGSGRLVLCSPNQQVRRLLKITGLDSSIGIFDDPEPALAQLNA